MHSNESWVARSRQSVWHPCTQMKHHEQFPLVPIASAQGVWLTDAEGHSMIDGVSSWWVNLFGHANPRINAALKAQLDVLEHAMLAGFTHEPVITLSERLAALSGLGHAFYASDGASAVEIALKMSFHAWRNRGRADKRRFVALEGSYHGETIGALGVTDVALFRDAYGPLITQSIKVQNPSKHEHFKAKMPENARGLAGFTDAPCCGECVHDALAALERTFAADAESIAAFIVEPLVQGANGMRMTHPDYLRGARALCDRYEVHLIADEIMTGFGRTGTFFAHQQAEIRPDLLCLSKGITGGYLPLSCVLSTDDIYSAFYDDDVTRGFLHSHSYTGSALACRAALETLAIFDDDDVLARNAVAAQRFSMLAAPLAQHSNVYNARHLGMIWAFEVASSVPHFSREFFTRALRRGVLLRPIGNTVYFMPPYVISEEEFVQMVNVSCAVIDELL